MNSTMFDASNMLVKRYNPFYIVLSWVVSLLGSFTTLVVLQQMPFTKRKIIKLLWLLMASICLGVCAVWSMHFVGMISFSLHMQDGTQVLIEYEVLSTIFSLIIAVMGSLIGLSATAVREFYKFKMKGSICSCFKSKKKSFSDQKVLPTVETMTNIQVPTLAGSILFDVNTSNTLKFLKKMKEPCDKQEKKSKIGLASLKSFIEGIMKKKNEFDLERPYMFQIVGGGLGVAAAALGMHYLGMQSQTIPGRMHHNWILVALSVVIAVVTGTAGLILSFYFNKSWQQFISAAVMATAISSMHYTGMESSTYYYDPTVTHKDRILLSGETTFLVAYFATFLLCFVMVALVTFVVGRERLILFNQLEKEYNRLVQQQEVSEMILLNILPKTIKARMETGEQIVDTVYESSILFADLVGFTSWSLTVSAERLVSILNEIFCLFDDVIPQDRMEKIKTIGDCYMLASGVTAYNPNHCKDACAYGILMISILEGYNRLRSTDLKMRIGISSGRVVAAVVGKSKFCYDVWGSTVNIASRMESNGIPMSVTVSPASYELVKDVYSFEPHDNVFIKGKGHMTIYHMNPVPKVQLPDEFYRDISKRDAERRKSIVQVLNSASSHSLFPDAS